MLPVSLLCLPCPSAFAARLLRLLLGECIAPQIVEELHHGSGILCHCIVQYKVGVTIESQQLRLFKSQAYDVGNDFLVVVLVIVIAAVDVGLYICSRSGRLAEY